MMRSSKIAAVSFVLSMALGTTAKSATLENVLNAVHQHFQFETLSELKPYTQNEIICLALNQYHESRGDSEAGIMAVGFSTRNRVIESKKSYCSTIWERGQYIWSWRAVSGIVPKEKSVWQRIVERAKQIVTASEDIDDPTHGADSFYIKKLNPSWARHSPVHVIIGAHCFVKQNGRT